MIETRIIKLHTCLNPKDAAYEIFVFVPHIMGLKRNMAYDPNCWTTYTNIIMTNNHEISVAETVEQIIEIIKSTE